MTLSRMATSRTVRAIGPAVSWLMEMGMIPERLTSPTVGLIPTMPLMDEGPVTDPSVSVPTAAAHRLRRRRRPNRNWSPTDCDPARKDSWFGRRVRSSRWWNAWNESWPTR